MCRNDPREDPYSQMKPLRDFPIRLCKDVTTVLFDIDDTITHEGRLPSQSYVALENLARAGFRLVAVTGRPAGWCDMIARFWPVDGVVGENGAFYFRYDYTAKKMSRAYQQDEDTRTKNRARLLTIYEQVSTAFPDISLASDQPFRACDLAVDFNEDVKPHSLEDADAIREIFEGAGATAKVSSIHVNAWFGDFDKLAMAQRFFLDVFEVNLDSRENEVVFIGDSPNDVAMFRFFSNSVGVANITSYTALLSHPPVWVTERQGGFGFAELADHLLGIRNAFCD